MNQQNENNLNSTLLGDIVTNYPATAEVFKTYRIDFCCGGNRPLGEILAEQGSKAEEISGKLMEACRPASNDNEAVNWKEKNNSELIDHIVNKHHAYLYDNLPETGQYLTTIVNVHGSGHPELSEVRKLFQDMYSELMSHLPDEEQNMFPFIKEMEQNPSPDVQKKCIGMVEELEDEHESCGHILKEIRSITKDYEIPADACPTYKLTFKKLEELESDLFEHIHLENNILFPRVLNNA